MNRTDETKLRASLTLAIEGWLEGPAQEARVPYVGNDIAGIMAQAALAVLAGVADVYETLRNNGELKDDE